VNNSENKLNLNFFYKSILDDKNINNVRNLFVSMIRANICRYSHLKDLDLIEKKNLKIIYLQVNLLISVVNQ
jgi:hypothetical protein